MKNEKLVFARLICCIGGIAQTTITTTSQIGYTAPLIIASSSTGTTVPVSTTGAGVTWNCSNLMQEPGTPVINYTVSSPAGTMFASDYPSSNWYFTDPALSSVIGHHYYSLNADSMVLWGEHVPGNSYEIYDNPEMELPLPFAYNSTVVNTYSKTNYYSNGTISSYQTGTNTITYDSYGTLILPAGTFSNVARITNVRTNSLGSTTTSYHWYLATTGEKLLEYETNGGIKVVYNNSAPTGVGDNIAESNPIKIYPNPASGKFIVNLADFETGYNNHLKISDFTGKEVRNVFISAYTTEVDCSDLPPGIYFYHFTNINRRLKTGKLILN